MKPAKFATAVFLILCIVPCLFIIPVFCGPIEMTISEEEDFCPLLSFALTSNTLLLAENIMYPVVPDSVTILENPTDVSNIPIVFFEKDIPPEVRPPFYLSTA